MADRKPNVLFFFTDDQRFDTINALGNPHIITPTLDSLAREGVAFTHAHIMGGTVGAVCMPSRAMLMTGRTLFHLDSSGRDIPLAHEMMGETFQRAGYECFGTGKWHNGKASYARSFSDGGEIMFGGMNDHWNVPVYRFDPEGKYDSLLPYCPDAWHSNEVRHKEADHVTAGRHSSELFAGETMDFLRRRDPSRPFFAYVSFMAPHDPRTMPREYLDMYEENALPLPENFLGAHPFDNGNLYGRDEELEAWPRTPEAVRRHTAEYFAMITHADAQIGRVLEALEASGEKDNTIIIFAGDNGLAVGRHGLMGKQNVYEHSVRVPLIFCGPGIPQGERREVLCYLLDIFPTLCDLCGLERPSSVEGVSLGSSLNNPAASHRDILYLAYRDVQRGVRDHRFKLIEYVVDGSRTTQLFNLQDDPWEMNNLADESSQKATLEHLRNELKRLAEELDDGQPDLGGTFWEGFNRK